MLYFILNIIFEWCVVPEDPYYCKLLIIIQLLAGIGITIGFFYKTSSIIFFLAFSYMYMFEQSLYLNHFYLVSILSFMMVLLPCNCLFSVDAYLFPKSCYSKTCPKWCLLLVKLELGIVYTYAGVCKINEDWLRGEPLRNWLSHRINTPFIGHILTRESTAYFMSYGGLIYDLSVALLLTFRKTLPIGIALSVFFHISNKIVFNIGIFPWMMLASTTFYFSPDWPRRVYHYFSSSKTYKPIPTKKFSETAPRKINFWEYLVIFGCILFLLHQILCPIRLHTYPGVVGWNEYGHQFSWRMKLRTKKCDSTGFAYNEELDIGFSIPVEKMLNPRQYRKMSSRPDMIVQFGHFAGEFLDNQLKAQSNLTIPSEVYIEAWCELNGRPYQRFTDPKYNLANATKWQYPYPWVTDIEPLTEKEKKNYPWNWDWNWNFLKGIDRLPIVKREDMQRRASEMKETAREKWINWLQERSPTVRIQDVF